MIRINKARLVAAAIESGLTVRAIPIDPTDVLVTQIPVMQIVKQLGMPQFQYTAKEYHKLLRPILYVLARQGVPLYIGMSQVGGSRPLSPDHQALHNIKPGDRLYIWALDSSFKVEQLEAELIARFTLSTTAEVYRERRERRSRHFSHVNARG